MAPALPPVRWEQPQLLHQAQSIVSLPLLGYLASFDAVDGVMPLSYICFSVGAIPINLPW